MTVIVQDDLTRPATLALIAEHVAAMREGSPEESCHVLADDALRQPHIRVFTAWREEELLGMGAIATLDEANGEIKSMRTTQAARGTGVGRALVEHLINQARADGMSALWLETGSDDSFIAARNLYERYGFVECEPFGSYLPDPNSTFMTLAL